MFGVQSLFLIAAAALSMTATTTLVMGHGMDFSSCGPGIAFLSIESKINSEINITASEFCSEFDEEDECKEDEYNACNWCNSHEPSSKSKDRSARCVTTEYHWEECLRVVSKPRARIKHKFDWSKQGEGGVSNDAKKYQDNGHVKFNLHNIARLQQQQKEMYAREKAEADAEEAEEAKLRLA